MTNRERGFLDAVLADPSDDFLRLVYADWLEDEERTEQTEFIRVQVELASLPLSRRCVGTCGGYYCDVSEDGHELHRDCRFEELRQREREELKEWWLHWCDAAFGPLAGVWREPGDDHTTARFRLGPDGDAEIAVTFRRGFVASLSLTLADFLTHAGAIFAVAPVEEVRLTDREPLEGGWRLGSLSVCPGRTSYELTAQIYHLLTGKDHLGGKRYDDDAHAIAALSEACVWYGRRRAGLLPMRFRKEAVSP